jgi:imidazoleglycerol phosphate synthase glutamine amidotransferase subunit HisH
MQSAGVRLHCCQQKSSMTVGILALQGDFREHEEMLRRIGAPTLQVRLPKHLEQVERLIIPGGESTTIGKLLAMYGLIEPLRARIRDGMPVWGTCAGAILLAQRIADGARRSTVTPSDGRHCPAECIWQSTRKFRGRSAGAGIGR